jgi:tetratricopeptide (TPR) repeat protein
MNVRAAIWLAGVISALGAGARAQTAAGFDAAWATLVAAPRGEWPQAAVRASDAFLALPPGDDRSARLENGIEAALFAGRRDLALDLALEGRAGGRGSDRLVTLHLRALLQLGRLDAFVASAREDLATHRTQVEAALVAEQATALPLADAALRRGDTATGRFVFEQLATIEPADPWRLANYALACRHLGDLQAAADAYERACRLAPDDAMLQSDHGLFLRAIGDREAALAAFRRSLELDTATPGGRRGQGPAITNLMHGEALRPGSVRPDPLPDAAAALAQRPDAAMLRRLLLDTTLDRLVAARRPHRDHRDP